MDKEEITNLTIKLYKLTLLFPKKEPLRLKSRETAGSILANIVAWKALKQDGFAIFTEKDQENLAFSIKRDLKVIFAYLEVAKWQNWVSYFDVLKIQEEYGILIEKFKTEALLVKEVNSREKKLARTGEIIEKKAKAPEKPSCELNSRESKIIEVLKERGRVQVGEISRLFPEISKRTIRRDFVELLKNGLIERIGEKNNTFYQLISR